MEPHCFQGHPYIQCSVVYNNTWTYVHVRTCTYTVGGVSNIYKLIMFTAPFLFLGLPLAAAAAVPPPLGDTSGQRWFKEGALLVSRCLLPLLPVMVAWCWCPWLSNKFFCNSVWHLADLLCCELFLFLFPTPPLPPASLEVTLCFLLSWSFLWPEHETVWTCTTCLPPPPLPSPLPPPPSVTVSTNGLSWVFSWSLWEMWPALGSSFFHCLTRFLALMLTSPPIFLRELTVFPMCVVWWQHDK